MQNRTERIVLRSMGRVAWVGRVTGLRGFGLSFIEPDPTMLTYICVLIRDRHVSVGL